MADALLELEELEVAYHGVPAVRALSLIVERGEIVGLIGPNGAGKSTTLHAIMGLAPVASGDVTLAGRSLRGKAPEDVARSGIALVPEGRRIFSAGAAHSPANSSYSSGSMRSSISFLSLSSSSTSQPS